jgi:hypothetical protein
MFKMSELDSVFSLRNIVLRDITKSSRSATINSRFG